MKTVRKKLAVVTTHPIQYNAPLFKLMSNELDFETMVFYTWGEASIGSKYDPDFGQEIEWDIPLLDGYQYTFVDNVSDDPGSHHFNGIINPTLNREIQAWHADVVWVWGWAFNSHLKVLRNFKGKVPVWFRGDSTLLNEPLGLSLRKIARRLFLRWVYKHIDKAFFVGAHNKAYFFAHGLQDSQLVFAPHAIDNERFKDPTGILAEDARNWRRDLEIADNKKILIYVGKFEQKKNPLFFKKIVAKLEDEDFVGIMVGNGSLEDELRNSASSNLLFLPFQNQSKMPVVYRLADVLILPSKGPGETWGLVMNEALASGIKVLASHNCGGAIDLLDETRIFQLNESDVVNKIYEVLRESKKKNVIYKEFDIKYSYAKVVESILSELRN